MKSKLTLLSIDDNFADQELMVLGLKAADSDSNLQTVGNGEDAISYLRKKGKYTSAPRPDLLIMDLNLPKVSGLEVIREVRKDPELREIPIVLFTGAKAPSEIVATSEFDTTYIVKPDGVDAFFDVMKAIDEYAHRMAETPAQGTEHGEKLRHMTAA